MPLKKPFASPMSVTAVPPFGTESRHDAESISLQNNFREVAAFRFLDEVCLKSWEQKIFKGSTRFEVLKESGLNFLRSRSKDACCGLFMKSKQTPAPNLYLSWKWRVLDFPKKKSPQVLSNRAEDDFGARVYVIFEATNLFHSDVLEYIWDESLPVGTTADSPYSDRIKLLVVRSGKGGADGEGWCAEIRNPLSDYEKLFGKKPKNPIGIVALMSDSDNTQSSASADFADIIFKAKETA